MPSEYADGAPFPYCPMSRMPCMGRDCAAAHRMDLGRMQAIATGHKTEWTCAQFGNVADYDEAMPEGAPHARRA